MGAGLGVALPHGQWHAFEKNVAAGPGEHPIVFPAASNMVPSQHSSTFVSKAKNINGGQERLLICSPSVLQQQKARAAATRMDAIKKGFLHKDAEVSLSVAADAFLVPDAAGLRTRLLESAALEQQRVTGCFTPTTHIYWEIVEATMATLWLYLLYAEMGGKPSSPREEKLAETRLGKLVTQHVADEFYLNQQLLPATISDLQEEGLTEYATEQVAERLVLVWLGIAAESGEDIPAFATNQVDNREIVCDVCRRAGLFLVYFPHRFHTIKQLDTAVCVLCAAAKPMEEGGEWRSLFPLPLKIDMEEAGTLETLKNNWRSISRSVLPLQGPAALGGGPLIRKKVKFL